MRRKRSRKLSFIQLVSYLNRSRRRKFNFLSDTLEEQPPVIIDHPDTDQAVEPGPLNFSVTATGSAPLSYQWQINDGSWSDIPGATSSSYTINPSVKSQNGQQVRCVVANALGTVTSDAAFISVLQGAYIITQPAGTVVTEPEQAEFSVSASGDATLAYQWQENSGSGWVDLVSETSATLTLSPTDDSMSGRQYRCEVSNNFGSEISNEVTLTVNELVIPAPLSITMARTTNSDSVSWGATGAENGNGTIRYKWDDSDTSSGATIATVASGPFTSPSLTPGKHWLYVEEQDGGGGYLPMVAKQVNYWTPEFGSRHNFDTGLIPDVDSWGGKFRVTTAVNQVRGTTDNNTHVCRFTVASYGTALPTVITAIVQPVGSFTRFHWGTNTSTKAITFDLSGAGSATPGGSVNDVVIKRLSQDYYYVQFRIPLTDGDPLDIRTANSTSGPNDSYVSSPSDGVNIWDIQAVPLDDFSLDTVAVTIQPTTATRQTFLGVGGSLGDGSAGVQYSLLNDNTANSLLTEISGTVDALRVWLKMQEATPAANFIDDYVTNAQLADYEERGFASEVLVVVSGIESANRTGTGSGSGQTFVDNAAIDAHCANVAGHIKTIVDAGVGVSAVDAINEPDVSSADNFATPSQTAYLLKQLRSELDAQGLTSLLIVSPSTSSHNGLGASAASSWEAYADAILADPVALAAVDHPSAHTYGLGMQDVFIPKMQQIGNEWQTEAGAAQVDENNVAYPNGQINGCSYAARFINDVGRWCERWFVFIAYAQTDNDFPNTRDADHALWRYDPPTQTLDPRPQSYYLELLNRFKGTEILEWTAPVNPANALDAWRSARRPYLWPLVAQKPGGGVLIALLNFTSALIPDIEPAGPTSDRLPYHAKELDVTLDLSNLSGLLASNEAVTISTLGGELTPMGHPQVDFEVTETAAALSGYSLLATVNPGELIILETE